jgi:FkbM family methyltransferase
MHTATSASNHRLLDRVGQGVARRVRRVRDRVEWQAAATLVGRSPWCRNRWGHRYQAISLADYHYLRDGNPETHEARLLERLLRPGMTVVDVGANHGLFSLEALVHVGRNARIHAFEPAPDTRAVLIDNLAANGQHGIRVFPQALGAAPGTARLRVHRGFSGLNTLADHDITWNHRRLAADAIVDVPVTTLDAHAAAEGLDHVDFLKIDVEGFEPAVLRGAADLLRTRRVRWVLVEIGDATCANAGCSPEEVRAALARHGYVLHAITPEGAIGARVEAFPAGSFSANFLAFLA